MALGVYTYASKLAQHLTFRVSFFLRRCTFNGDYDQYVDKCICVALFVQTLISPSRWERERESNGYAVEIGGRGRRGECKCSLNVPNSSVETRRSNLCNLCGGETTKCTLSSISLLGRVSMMIYVCFGEEMERCSI